MASTTVASEGIEGPVLSLLNKRLRALRKKCNRISQMEEAVALGKPLNSEQQEVLRSKPAVTALIDELEKLRSPISSAVQEEINIALQGHNQHEAASNVENQEREKSDNADSSLDDLLHLLYFGSLFDVKSYSDFTSIMLTRTHERESCLTYDYVTDDATDLLGEKDMDLISVLGSLMISRPLDSNLSHKEALLRCTQHVKLWLANSDTPIDSNSDNTYAGLRSKLKKIMASDYFTTTPEMKPPVEVAAATGNFAFHAPIPISLPQVVELSVSESQQKDEEGNSSKKSHEMINDENLQKGGEDEKGIHEEVEIQQEANAEHDEGGRDQPKEPEQYIPRRNYANQRGGRGGGRRGYSNGRGGRDGGRGGYQNGRPQYYDQPGNYYPRNYYNNSSRGRGGRGGGPHMNGSAAHAQNQADAAGVAA